MFSTLRTFKTLFLSVLPLELYNLLKDCHIEKIIIQETDEETEFISKEKIEECLFSLITESEIVNIECDLELEMLIREKYLEDLERACLILNCTGLEFKNNKKDFTSTLQKILENS